MFYGGKEKSKIYCQYTYTFNCCGSVADKPILKSGCGKLLLKFVNLTRSQFL